MNIPHVHLLLNHIPVLGAVVGLGLFLLSLVRKNDDLKRASLEVWFIVSLLTIPAYLSGNAAEQAIAERPDVAAALMTVHEDAAVFAFIAMQITGVLAWAALWQYRRNSPTRVPLDSARGGLRWTLSAVLILSVVTVAAMARTATLGGEIRHPEIAAADAAAATAAVAGEPSLLSAAWISAVVISSPWTWPTNETLHFIGLTLVFAVVMPLNLRVLGLMRAIPFAALHRLLPWAIAGFVLNVVTGMMFFVASAEQYTLNPAFYWKIAFLMLAGANILYLTSVDDVWEVGAGARAPALARAVAASSLFVWFGVIFWGRLMPFLGLTF
jgi:hypothetical protein